MSGMKRGSHREVQSKDNNTVVPLCASCDRCRARKTRCDGQRPCGNCAAKYMKTHKVTSIEGIDLKNFECVYSPAKRRGPVPGRGGQARKSNEANKQDCIPSSLGRDPTTSSLLHRRSSRTAGLSRFDEGELHQILVQQKQIEFGANGLRGLTGTDAAILTGNASIIDAGGGAPAQLHQLKYLQKLGSIAGPKPLSMAINKENAQADHGCSSEAKIEPTGDETTPDTVTAHLPLLRRDSVDGNRLRAFYRLSVDELFTLPPISVNSENVSKSLLPKPHTSALIAAHFAEIAIGALVHNELPFSLELCNATIYCLRECVKDTVKLEYAFDVVRSFFLLSYFYIFRGDMVRYFKYRRVCLIYLSKFDTMIEGESILSAMSYLDALTYMMYNATESKLPNIDGALPRVPNLIESKAKKGKEENLDRTYSSLAVASDSKNQMWIQGPPLVYLNESAPLRCRSLDALAFAVRSCCDLANERFALIEKEVDSNSKKSNEASVREATENSLPTPVDELSCRNMVSSSFKLLRQHQSLKGTSTYHNQGHHMIILAMDAFLESNDQNNFTDGKVQSLLSVCNIVIENPLLLHHAGPSYHLISNAAILLCHFMNGMHASNTSLSNGTSREMEAVVFEEVLDTFLSTRKLLNSHRRKLPVDLRCHQIPRPNMQGPVEGQTFVDLGENLICGCRGCQGFALMACNPSVAAKRARFAAQKREIEAARELKAKADENNLGVVLNDVNTEFGTDDDALLTVLSQIVTA